MEKLSTTSILLVGHFGRIPTVYRGAQGSRRQDQDRAEQGRHGGSPAADARVRRAHVEPGQGARHTRGGQSLHRQLLGPAPQV